MIEIAVPDAFLAISGQCPHCPVVLAGLGEVLKQGLIGRIEVVNIQARPELARTMDIRSVPWLRIGPFELTGLHSQAELALWARRAATPEGLAEAFHDMLKTGGLARVLAMLETDPVRLAALLPILANPEASLNVRLGAGAVLEHLAGSQALRLLIPALCELVRHADGRVRADACYALGLSGHESARDCLLPALADTDAEVREIAAEALDSMTR